MISLFLILLLSTSVMAQEAGKFSLIHQDVTRNNMVAKIPDPVFVLDTIKTGSDSRARITLHDSSKLNIAPKSTITIEDYMIQKDTVIHLIDGVLEFDGNAIIKTPTAIAGIRG